MYEGTLVIVILVVLIMVVVYYMYDYYYYKLDVAGEFVKTHQQVDTEKGERLGDVKSVVDQVNVAHDGIYDEFQKTKLDINATTSNLSALTMGLNSAMSFRAGDKNIAIRDIPGATNPDMNLLTHVSSLGGLTIKDLDKSKPFKICGKENPDQCIEIPDANGNIYLRNLYGDRAIALDGHTMVNAPLSITDASRLGVKITGNQDGSSFMETNALGVGSTKGTPGASLHVLSKTSDSTPAAFRVSVDGKDVLGMDKTGTLTTKKIQLKYSADATTSATMEVLQDGSVRLTAPTVQMTGNLLVGGSVSQNTSAPPSGTTTTGTTSGTTTTGTTSGTTTTGTTSDTTTGTTSGTTTTGTTSGTTTGTTSGTTVSGFTSGPIRMRGAAVPTPVDYLNSRYLMPVPVR